MEEKDQEPRKEEGYVPRPAWQVWGARIGLALFIGLVAMGYLIMFRGG